MDRADYLPSTVSPAVARNAAAHSFYRRRHVSQHSDREIRPRRGSGSGSAERELSAEPRSTSPPPAAQPTRRGGEMGEWVSSPIHPPLMEEEAGGRSPESRRRGDAPPLPIPPPLHPLPEADLTAALPAGQGSRGRRDRRGSHDDGRHTPTTPLDHFYSNPTNQKEYIERLHRELPLARGVDEHGNVIDPVEGSSSSPRMNQSMCSGDYSVASVELYGVPQAYQKRGGGGGGGGSSLRISTSGGSVRKSKSSSVYVGSPFPHMQKKYYPTPVMDHGTTPIISVLGGRGGSLGVVDSRPQASPFPSSTFSPSISPSGSGRYREPDRPQTRSSGHVVVSTSISSERATESFHPSPKEVTAATSPSHPKHKTSTTSSSSSHRSPTTRVTSPKSSKSKQDGGTTTTTSGALWSDTRMNNVPYRPSGWNSALNTSSSIHSERGVFRPISSAGGGGWGGGGVAHVSRGPMLVGVTMDHSAVKRSATTAALPSTVFSGYGGSSMHVSSVHSMPLEVGELERQAIPDSIALPSSSYVSLLPSPVVHSRPPSALNGPKAGAGRSSSHSSPSASSIS